MKKQRFSYEVIQIDGGTRFSLEEEQRLQTGLYCWIKCARYFEAAPWRHKFTEEFIQ